MVTLKCCTCRQDTGRPYDTESASVQERVIPLERAVFNGQHGVGECVRATTVLYGTVVLQIAAAKSAADVVKQCLNGWGSGGVVGWGRGVVRG